MSRLFIYRKSRDEFGLVSSDSCDDQLLGLVPRNCPWHTLGLVSRGDGDDLGVISRESWYELRLVSRAGWHGLRLVSRKSWHELGLISKKRVRVGTCFGPNSYQLFQV